MHQNQKMLFGITLCIIVLFSGISYNFTAANPSTITEAKIETAATINLESNAQRLSLQIDDFNNRHIIYLTGDRPDTEPDAIPYNGTHNLKYGFYVDNVLTVEDVTSDLVFPYHYDMRVDSIGQVHIAYIANNYTLYYAVRDPSDGFWTITQLSTPSEMWAMMPGISLGTNEQPRIVYSVRYKEDADLFFNQEGFELVNLSSLLYAVLNSTTWLYFDVGDNHATSPFNQRDLNRQRIYNPGIKVEDENAYIAFTNKVALAVDTRMQYIKIPEIPDFTEFLPKIHQRAVIAASQATTYRRPDIHIIGEGVLIAFGAWSFGGASIAYLTNSSILQDPNPALAREQWESELLLSPAKQNRQVDSVSSIVQNGTIKVIYSVFDLFNAEENQFSHDLFVATFTPDGVELGDVEIDRITDTTMFHHYSPNIAETATDGAIILYITEDENGLDTKLVEIKIADIMVVTEPVPTKIDNLEWNRTYGGIGTDIAYAITQTSDGGYALAGSTFSFGVGRADMWLVKTDNRGNMLWNKTFGGALTDIAFAIVQTSDGGFALAGYTYSFQVGGSEMWLVKTDNQGNMEWDQTYGRPGDDVANGLVQTSDGGFALAGYTLSSEAGGSDMWLVKTDNQGNMEWNQTYIGFNWDFTNPLIQTSDSGFAMILSEGMIKTDVSGTVEWNQTYNELEPRDIIQTTDGGFAIIGEIDFNIKLVKTDRDGTITWEQSYIPQWTRRRAFAFADSLIQTADKGFMLAGSTGAFSAGGFDMWLIKTDFEGVEKWNQTYGGVGLEMAFGLIESSDGGFALVGSSNSFGAGGNDMWLLKLKSIGEANIDDTKFNDGREFLGIGLLLGFVTLSVVIIYYARMKRRHD